jgi:hypothetical protein
MTVSHPDDRTMRVQELKRQIANSEYAVDAHAVAEALLRRWALQVSRSHAHGPRPLEVPRHPQM